MQTPDIQQETVKDKVLKSLTDHQKKCHGRELIDDELFEGEFARLIYEMIRGRIKLEKRERSTADLKQPQENRGGRGYRLSTGFVTESG